MGGVGLLGGGGGSGGAFAILWTTAGAAFGNAIWTSPSTFAPFEEPVREVEPLGASSAMTRAAIAFVSSAVIAVSGYRIISAMFVLLSNLLRSFVISAAISSLSVMSC